MKKILSLALLLLSSLSIGQNIEFLTSLKSLPDYDTTLKVANDMANLSGIEMVLYKKSNQDKEGRYRLTYVPKEFADKKLDINKLSKDQLAQIISFDFIEFYEGENKSLEVKGIKKYWFSTVTANYLNLFKIWQAYIDPNADPEKLLNSVLLQKYADKEKHLEYRLYNTGYIWELKNQSH